MLLLLTRSWLGKENHELEGELARELPGILNWALDGLKRLTIDNGNRFTRIESADEAIIAMRDLASPVGAFVRERCIVDAKKEIKCDALYSEFKNWCEANEYPKSSKHVFGRDLRAAVPSVRVGQRGTHPDRVRVYQGISLQDAAGQAPDDGGLL